MAGGICDLLAGRGEGAPTFTSSLMWGLRALVKELPLQVSAQEFLGRHDLNAPESRRLQESLVTGDDAG